MGYYVETTDISFRIKAENLDATFKAACELNNRNELKHGGRYPKPEGLPDNEPNEYVWFSWVAWNYHETCKNLLEVFDEFGFEGSELDSNGDFLLGWYNSKTGNEDALLKAVAPFVEDGSYVRWRGEEGGIWGQRFQGGEMITQLAEVTWIYV